MWLPVKSDIRKTLPLISTKRDKMNFVIYNFLNLNLLSSVLLTVVDVGSVYVSLRNELKQLGVSLRPSRYSVRMT